MSPLVDREARERIVGRLDESQFVEAAAGTGKTRILVERLVEVIASGCGELASIVVVTFTEKAAGELKLRVREAIEKRRRAGASAHRQRLQPRRLQTALEQLEEAHISTIHGFCADLLREYPVEAGVDPDFVVQGDEAVGKTLFGQVFERWLEQQQRDGLGPAMDRVLRRRGMGADSPAVQLYNAAAKLREHRDLDAPWEQGVLDLAAEVQRFCQCDLAPVAALAQQAVAANHASLEPLMPLITLDAEVRSRQTFDPRDLEARLWSLRSRIYPGRGRRGPLRDQIETALAQFANALAGFRQRSGAQLAAMLQRELMPCLDLYEAAKRESGQLDFMDLLLRVRRLLVSNDVVRSDLRRRFSHVFIDEFQDTDPLQAEILLLLASDDEPEAEVDFNQLGPRAGKLFVVGDPKQSIYSFRRADVQLYESLKARLSAEGSVSVLQLTTSFRAVAGLQQAVNAAFAPLMGRDSPEQGGMTDLQPAYVALSPVRQAAPHPAIVALPVPAPYGFHRRITKRAIRQSEPNAVAAWIDWVLRESGWSVSVRGALQEPIAPHHICLLFRQLRARSDDLTRPYVEALEARRVPHVVVGGRSYFAREEVDALVTALRVIEWPDDEVSVYAVLRGPLFGFDDERLYLFRKRGGRFDARLGKEVIAPDLAHPRSLFESALTAEPATIEAALSILGSLHAGRNHRPLSQTVGSLLAATRCVAGFALRPNGEQAVASLLRLQDLARRFSAASALSFRAFVEYLESQIDSELADAENPVFEAGRGGVRMMSVHRAKGLEFPVVILADVACGPSKKATALTDRRHKLYATPLCHCVPLPLQKRQSLEDARQAAEEVRLLYVAATRARDTLVIPTLPEQPDFETWLDPLAPVVRSDQPNPSGPEAKGPAGSAVAAGATSGIVKPRAGEHDVWYWDLNRLGLEVDDPLPLRDSALIRAEGPGSAAAVERYRQSTRSRKRHVEQGSIPLCQVYSATILAHHGALFLPHLTRLARSVRVERIHGPGGAIVREGEAARRFGNLVHGTLELLSFRDPPTRAQLEQTVALVAQILGANRDEQQEAVERVQEALRHELFERFAEADALFREIPLSLRLDPPGEPPLIVEGIADVVFRRGDLWTVVDYKTDARPQLQQTAAYKRQVSYYLDALGRGFGGLAEGYLLFV